MLGQLAAGRSARAVAREFRTTHTTVLALKKRFEETGSVDYKPRSGRPNKLTKTEKRYIQLSGFIGHKLGWRILRIWLR
ncbi:hypothetical protein V2G26_003963 [Clonostachys chloroleuca]